jgi:hypothetical protein
MVAPRSKIPPDNYRLLSSGLRFDLRHKHKPNRIASHQKTSEATANTLAKMTFDR